MFKKFLSLAIVAMLIVSMCVVAASAAQVEIVNDAADTAAEVGADAVAETGSSNVISFDTASAGWKNFDYISFHIWCVDDTSQTFYEWGGRRQRGTDTDGDGVWTYDLDTAGITLNSSNQYAVIFYASTGVQTYNLLFGTPCLGDTARCNGTEYENPEDSNKTALAAFWDKQDKSVYGPELKISSIGTVVGTCCPANTTPYKMFCDFLTNTLTNARSYSGKEDQALLDDTASALGIGQDLIAKAIEETGVDVKWTAADSSASEKSDAKATQTGNGTDTSTTTNTNTGSGSGTSSSTKSGSGTTSQTGQETTVLYIMLGVMVAAAGVIFFFRRKDRA